MVRFLADFLRWWLTEIGDLLHVDLLKTSLNAMIASIDADSVTLSLRKRGKVTSLGHAPLDGDLSAAFAEKLQALADRPAFTLISVPEKAIIRRRLSLPIEARRNLDELLSYELERETPFTKDEVYWGYTVSPRSAIKQPIQVELVVIPIESVDHLRETARRLGLEPNGVEVQFDGSAPLFIPFRERRRVRKLGFQRTSRRSMVLTAGLAVVAVCLPFLFQQQLIAKTDRDIASLDAEAGKAMAIRKSMDSMKKTGDFLAAERLRSGSALGALAVTTRLIPNDSYLVAFSLRQEHLTLTGLSPSAAKLITLFAQSPSFREPSFVSPVVQSEGAGLETFTMTVTPTASAWQ